MESTYATHNLHDIGDLERIAFLKTRDTATEVVDFARRCISIYRRATLSSWQKNGRGGVYRVAFIRSYLFHKRYILENT